MALTRRSFCGVLGATLPAVALDSASLAVDDGPIRIDNNENPYGPSPAARAAIAKAVAEGGRYPSSQQLVAAIARVEGIPESSVLLTVGATEALLVVAKAFTGPAAGLVTAAPSYPAIATATELLGHPVTRIPIRADGALDLDQMADRARGSGVVYLCNPNNPTGVLVPAAAIGDFVATLGAVAPAATVVIGEAYHEYLDASSYQSAGSLAMANPRVLITRTFSKLYGLAGLRLGYLIGREETLKEVGRHRVPIGANGVGIAAATAVLADSAERLRQRRLNREGRQVAERFFAERGWRYYPGEANYLFVDVRRDIASFRAACEAEGLLIGRPYPPADTWAMITIGTPADMRRAFAVLETVL